MLFNSLAFLVFLPAAFILYWSLQGSRRIQNMLILVSSYIFYGWWDYRFLSLLAFSTLADFFIGLALEKKKTEGVRKEFLILSLLLNLGILGFFKYYNFFLESWIEAWESLGVNFNIPSLNIILPIGISFYTFQTLSYTIDIYREKIKASKNLINFAAFVSFFPQLVAGPIERAANLLPQFSRKKTFNPEQAIQGINLILWGLFKKMVIADTCAIYADSIFNNYESYNSGTLILGAVYFSFQIYADFSGYTDIAIGVAKLFGFDLMRNFNYPYFSRNIGEFWRRWHISLSTWFRDYVYIPLGGSRGSQWYRIRNVAIVFLLSGFWHGANWTFIIWGAIHALLFIPLLITKTNRKYLQTEGDNKVFPSLRDFSKILGTFSLVTFTWIFFRSESVSAALEYINRIFVSPKFDVEYLPVERFSIELLILLAIFTGVEWFHRNYKHPFRGKFRWLKITAVIIALLTLGVYSDYQEFIYFQF
ncbi:MBOAT family protein [Salinimicrobium tongyeongense]|uniref:MBOAT family protein n=1 Tax=Salinimicrobium tongyeongense TaxID=2809707 RepID=A0ABY6NRW4_9FLAO|nr:MBOAT family protein [Salinimicrobium tongyeongense]